MRLYQIICSDTCKRRLDCKKLISCLLRKKTNKLSILWQGAEITNVFRYFKLQTFLYETSRFKQKTEKT